MNDYSHYELTIATEIATALNDQHSILLHLSFVRRYEESSLRKILAKVLAIPDHDVRTTRARYYTALVKQYGVFKGARN